MNDGNGFFGGGGDLIVTAFEVDGVVVVDAALMTEGKVEIEQSRDRRGTETVDLSEERIVPDGEGDETGAALAGVVLPVEFHLEDDICLLRSGDFCVGKQGDHSALEGAETAFDFTFGLGRGRDEMSHAEPA